MDYQATAELKVTEYICHACKHENRLTSKDSIRCSNCGKHILCKKRDPNHVVQLQAI